MSPIEEQVFEGSGYSIIAWANGQTLVLYQEFGSYQGEWLMLAKGEKEYAVYKATVDAAKRRMQSVDRQWSMNR